MPEMPRTSCGNGRRFALLLSLAALLLAGCGTFIPTQEPVSLTFEFPQVDEAYYQSLLPGFNEQYPHITITLKPYRNSPQSSSDAMILPWAMIMDSDTQFDALLPLDSYIDQEKDFMVDDFYPGVMSVFQNDGEQIAVPSGVDPWVMYYNKDLFDRYGVPYPQIGWTWDDFLARAQSLRYPEEQTYGYTSMQGYTDSLLFLYQYGGVLGDSNGNPTLNSPEDVAAIEWYVGLFRDYQVAPTTSQAQSDFGFSNNADTLGLISGKIAMFMAPLSNRGGQVDFPAEWNFNWGVVPLPYYNQAFTGAFFEGMGISKQSANPDAAWKWISYLSHQPHNRLVPARTSLANSAEYTQLVGEEVAQAGRDSMANAILASYQALGQFIPFIDVFFSTVDTLVNSDAIVQEELDKAQLQAEERVR